MDTLLTILGGFVLICCLAYFNDQEVAKRDDRLFESVDVVHGTEAEQDESLPLTAVANQIGGSLEG
jgi:hypothetical protein